MADAIAGVDVGQTDRREGPRGRRRRGDGRHRRRDRARRRAGRAGHARRQGRQAVAGHAIRRAGRRRRDDRRDAGRPAPTGSSIDAGQTLILDGEAFIRAANAAGIVVVGRERRMSAPAARSRRHRRRPSRPASRAAAGDACPASTLVAAVDLDRRARAGGGRGHGRRGAHRLPRAVRPRRCGRRRRADGRSSARSRAPFLERGVHVLVEKPMAASLAEADAMLAAGARVRRHARGRPHRALQPGDRRGAAAAARRRASSKCTG